MEQEHTRNVLLKLIYSYCVCNILLETKLIDHTRAKYNLDGVLLPFGHGSAHNYVDLCGKVDDRL